MNIATLAGRLGRDPETKDINGKQLTKFSVATKGYGAHTDWHNIETWGKTAELAAKYLQKGSMVGVIGSIRYTKKDDKTFTSIVADKIEFLSSKQERQEAAPVTGATTAEVDPFDIHGADLSSIPF